MKNDFPSHRNKTSVSRRPLVVGWVVALSAWLLACPLAWAQAPSWQSAYLAGGNAYSEVTGIATDASGNVYLAGAFSNVSLTLGAITLTNTVTSGSTMGLSRDAFVAKWSPISGTFVWAQKAGGTTNNDAATAIAVSGTSVYVVATLTGSGFGGVAANGGDYLIKFTDAGAISWAQPAGITVAGLAVSGTSVYLTGNFTGTVALGGLSLTSAGSYDVAVAKLTDAGSTGSFIWAQRAGSSGYDYANALVVSGSTIYMAASYDVAASFGATQLAAAGSGIVKLLDAGATGSFGWVQPVVAATFNRLAVGNGRLYATGRIMGTAAFGTTALTSPGNGSSFVASVIDGGSTAGFGWAQQLGDPTGTTAIHTVVAGGGAVYVAGRVAGTGTFGSITLPAPVNVGLFLARLTDAGATASYAWAVPASAFFSAYAHSLALYKGTLYLTGMLAGPVEFGSTTLPASGGPVAYLASLADETALAATPSTTLAGLEVAPNPAHNTVLVGVSAGGGAATLTLLDALGRAVRTQAGAPGTTLLDLTGLAPGVYALRVQVGQGQAVRQLVVE